MRIFKTREFGRFARRERISVEALKDAIVRAAKGIVDADLGNGVLKQRIARQGQGRSGGVRAGVWTVFVVGFAKNARANIDPDELVALCEAARQALAFSEAKVKALLDAKSWLEVGNGSH